LSLAGARESMKMLLDYGVENVKKRIMKLTDRLIKAVKEKRFELQTPEEEQCRSGIVNIKTRKPQKITERLAKKGIVVSARTNGVKGFAAFLQH